ncbi:hypothetical protein BB559_005758 [Furculomyces boomerangus]|nr:hypothetical protein BB559_005758 [Furculomyces boomerangus]
MQKKFIQNTNTDNIKPIPKRIEPKKRVVSSTNVRNLRESKDIHKRKRVRSNSHGVKSVDKTKDMDSSDSLVENPAKKKEILQKLLPEKTSLENKKVTRSLKLVFENTETKGVVSDDKNCNGDSEVNIFAYVPDTEISPVTWKRSVPIDISGKPNFGLLAPSEAHCCSVLRITPDQYLSIKLNFIKEGKKALPGKFKKRDAQKLCRIDVNKTSRIFEWFANLGWIPKPN